MPFRARALAEIAPKLPDPQEALEIARSIKAGCFRARALAKIAPKLPDSQEIVNEALEVAENINIELLKARALAEIAPKMLDPQKALELAKHIQNESWRARALAEIIPQLTELPSSEIYAIWREILYVLSEQTRKDLLSDLPALAPVILALGGEEALLETASAIQDVGRWWP